VGVNEEYLNTTVVTVCKIWKIIYRYLLSMYR